MSRFPFPALKDRRETETGNVTIRPVLLPATAARHVPQKLDRAVRPCHLPQSRRRSLAQPGERRAAHSSGVYLPGGNEPLIASPTNTRSNAPPVTAVNAAGESREIDLIAGLLEEVLRDLQPGCGPVATRLTRRRRGCRRGDELL